MTIDLNRLQTFLYLLMRDELPTGNVGRIVREIEQGGFTGQFSNGHLARHSLEVAEWLTAPQGVPYEMAPFVIEPSLREGVGRLGPAGPDTCQDCLGEGMKGGAPCMCCGGTGSKLGSTTVFFAGQSIQLELGESVEYLNSNADEWRVDLVLNNNNFWNETLRGPLLYGHGYSIAITRGCSVVFDKPRAVIKGVQELTRKTRWTIGSVDEKEAT